MHLYQADVDQPFLAHNTYTSKLKDFIVCYIFFQGPILQVEVEGSGFLYKQVRNMVHQPHFLVHLLKRFNALVLS